MRHMLWFRYCDPVTNPLFCFNPKDSTSVLFLASNSGPIPIRNDDKMESVHWKYYAKVLDSLLFSCRYSMVSNFDTSEIKLYFLNFHLEFKTGDVEIVFLRGASVESR